MIRFSNNYKQRNEIYTDVPILYSCLLADMPFESEVNSYWKRWRDSILIIIGMYYISVCKVTFPTWVIYKRVYAFLLWDSVIDTFNGNTYNIFFIHTHVIFLDVCGQTWFNKMHFDEEKT